MTSRRHQPRRPAKGHPAASRSGKTETLDMTVDALGAQGDGLARHRNRRVFLPGALPGEQVRAHVDVGGTSDWRGTVDAILSASPHRVQAPCPHFGPCGGCSLQHLAPNALADWKRGAIRQALGHRGLGDVPVDAVVRIPPGSRRRATLGWIRTASDLVLGFHAPASHRLEDVSQCALVSPALAALITPDSTLRSTLASVTRPGNRGQVVATETDTGLDLTLDLPADPNLEARERLAAFAETADVARLGLRIGDAWEPVAARRPPQVHFAGVPVALPPMAFLQPSRAGEAAITAAILARLPEETARALDLFAGLGTFSLPLTARGVSVLAVDAATEAMAALARTPLAEPGRLTTRTRDLMRDPLTGPSLADADVVVFDPPRAGAKTQAEALAAAGPPCLIAVSCNPATFARDARCLVDAGYSLETVTPIDQFPWSPHAELVARLTRSR